MKVICIDKTGVGMMVVPQSYGEMARAIDAEKDWRVHQLANGDAIIAPEFGSGNQKGFMIEYKLFPFPALLFHIGEYTIPSEPIMTLEDAKKILEMVDL